MACCPEESERRLPADFSDRLVAHVRARRRRARRAKALAALALAVVCSLVSVGFLKPNRPKGHVETCLVAVPEGGFDEKVSGWMLLGFFRECFRRTKEAKRKEKERVTTERQGP